MSETSTTTEQPRGAPGSGQLAQATAQVISLPVGAESAPLVMNVTSRHNVPGRRGSDRGKLTQT